MILALSSRHLIVDIRSILPAASLRSIILGMLKFTACLMCDSPYSFELRQSRITSLDASERNSWNNHSLLTHISIIVVRSLSSSEGIFLSLIISPQTQDTDFYSMDVSSYWNVIHIHYTFKDGVIIFSSVHNVNIHSHFPIQRFLNVLTASSLLSVSTNTSDNVGVSFRTIKPHPNNASPLITLTSCRILAQLPPDI
jgi:hypothetical protein